jgi:hypothetical protein
LKCFMGASLREDNRHCEDLIANLICKRNIQI